MLLELTQVTKQFDGRTILDGISLTVEAGESVAIVGPSGSGKSTLLNLMGALDAPTAGTVKLNGRDLTGLLDEELAGIRNREIGFIFQAHHLLPQLTVLENALLPVLSGGPDERVLTLLQRVGLGRRLSLRPGQLSGGESQRVAVVRALINRPKLLLADEPTGALDHATAESLADLLVQLNREEGVALVTVTHWPALAQRMARRYELRDGKLT
jgi:ABC-type lipoprotein export system ATPase subunit